jgi:hypothetical protein
MDIYIYRGAGLLAVFLPPAIVVPTGIVLNAVLGKAYLEEHEWILSLVIGMAGVVTSLVGYLLNRRDRHTEQSLFKRLFWAPHMLCFVRIEYWGVLYVLLGIVRFLAYSNYL